MGVLVKNTHLRHVSYHVCRFFFTSSPSFFQINCITWFNFPWGNSRLCRGILTCNTLCGSKIAYQSGYYEHPAKDYQHCSVWVSKVRVQAQSRERDDGEIKHVSKDGKGPAGNEPVARSKRRGPPCHWVHAEGNHNERKGACAGSTEMCHAASRCGL